MEYIRSSSSQLSALSSQLSVFRSQSSIFNRWEEIALFLRLVLRLFLGY